MKILFDIFTYFVVLFVLFLFFFLLFKPKAFKECTLSSKLITIFLLILIIYGIYLFLFTETGFLKYIDTVSTGIIVLLYVLSIILLYYSYKLAILIENAKEL